VRALKGWSQAPESAFIAEPVNRTPAAGVGRAPWHRPRMTKPGQPARALSSTWSAHSAVGGRQP